MPNPQIPMGALGPQTSFVLGNMLFLLEPEAPFSRGLSSAQGRLWMGAERPHSFPVWGQLDTQCVRQGWGQ